MTPADTFKNDPPELVTARDRELWKTARGELLAFAAHLEKKGITITAAQLRLAVRLADTHRFVLEV